MSNAATQEKRGKKNKNKNKKGENLIPKGGGWEVINRSPKGSVAKVFWLEEKPKTKEEKEKKNILSFRFSFLQN